MPNKNKLTAPNHLIDTYIDFDKSVEVARVETQWQSIVVEDYNAHRFLHIDSVAIQSAMNIALPHTIVLEAIQYLLARPLFFKSDPSRCLVAGVGGGSLIRFLRHHYPAIIVDCIDLDAEMFKVAQQYFSLPEADGRTQYIVDDAFACLKTLAGQPERVGIYDSLIINIDYGDQLPSQFLTKVFYQRCRNLLSDEGLLVINFIVDDIDALSEILKLIRLVFKRRCICIEVPGHYNIIVYAFKTQPDSELSFKAMKLRAEQCQQSFEIDFPAIWSAIRKTTPSIAVDKRKNKLGDIIP